DDRTIVRLNGEPGKLADLAAGQRVRVDYDLLRDGQRVARSVRIRGLNVEARSPVDAPAPKDASSKPDPNAVAGILRRVDYTEREIIVVASDAQKKEEKQHPFQVPENAKITKDGKPLKFDDLKEGQQVVVYAQVREGKKTATAIDVGATAAKPKAAQGNSTRIERFRRILQIVDSFLQMAEEGMPEQRP
ncbi:MAG TPA: DUF5666 domain-containing protein, partial [Gemmataceae bacterium]|nr:DUF5666 domain-containing protein [Gemmataceae bacterium]